MYYVYTRKAFKNGKIVNGYKEFKSRAAQIHYIATAPMSIAITACN